MRKNPTLNYRRRPGVDPLESRCLLSGGIEVVEVTPAPALISGTEFRQAPHPPDGFESLAISSFSSGPVSWPTPGFHHDFSPIGEYSTPAIDFRTYYNPQLVSILLSPSSELENAAVSRPNLESTEAFPGPPNHADFPPGSPPPPGQPPFFMFQGGDPERILHAEHDLSTRPSLDEMTLNSPEGTTQADEVTVSPAGGQSAVQSQGGNSIAQIAPSFIVSAGNLTALFKPASEHDGQSIPIAGRGETPGKQPVEADSANPPTSGSANMVSTDSAADEVAHRGDDVTAIVDDPMLSGNQTKLLLPQAAGLIANAVPFDQAALEKAVDQFFDQLESLGMGQFVEQGPRRVIPLSLALLSTLTAVEVARRRLKSRTGEKKATEGQNVLASEELLGYPELPGSWSTNLT
jgi:hypothetical protein